MDWLGFCAEWDDSSALTVHMNFSMIGESASEKVSVSERGVRERER